jgi:DNA-binding protein H-NS
MVRKSYEQLQEQIKALQEQADKVRAGELEEVLADVREKVAKYGLTEADVFGRKRAGSKQAAKTGAKEPSVAKYRDPKSGAEWSGRGRAPGWIVNARNRDRFLIA